MARRSTSQFKIDDRAFPIRVKVKVPASGLASLQVDPHSWLKAELDHLAWALGTADSIGCGQVTAYHFRFIEDARRFLEAFPELELADGVVSPAYSSPAKSAGPSAGPYEPHSIGNGWSGRV